MRYLLPILLSFVFCLHVDAQDTPADLPPILDPANIFAEGVEVTKTLPVLHSADEEKIIYYLPADAESWQTFDFPSDTEINSYYFDEHLLPDGTFLMTGEYAILFPGEHPPVYIRFDPISENFTRLHGQCGRDEYGTGRWILEKDTDEIFYLCNTGTGQRTNPLPDEIQQTICQGNFTYAVNFAISPDEDWAVFIACEDQQSYENGFTIFAYEMATGQYFELGRTNKHDTVRADQWIDSQNPIFYGSSSRRQEYRSLYTANLMHPSSLKLIGQSFISWPIFNVDPPRYVWINRRFEDVTVIDEDGTKGGGSALKSEIRQFNLETQQQATLLPQVMPCEYYISECFAFADAPLPNLVVVIEWVLDTDFTHMRVYRGDGAIIFETIGDWFVAEHQWVDDTLLYRLSYRKGGYSTQLLDLSAEHSRLIEIPGNILGFASAISSDGRAIISQRVGDFLTLSLYDIRTNQITPLTKPIDTTLYTVDAYWKDDNRIAVIVYDSVRSCCNEQFPLRHWIVQP